MLDDGQGSDEREDFGRTRPDVFLSQIGRLLWSDDQASAAAEWHYSSSSTLVSESDVKTELESNGGEVATEPVNEPASVARKRRANRHKRAMHISQVCQYLSRQDVDPHMLISPYPYGDPEGPGAGVSQPFQVKVHPQVSLLTDVHSHLCEAEVIGLLGGKWDSEKDILYVQAPFPCTSTERIEDDGSTDVEMDFEAQLRVSETIHSFGMQVVGWYHSHPLFRPDPSVTDVFNQKQYQDLFREEETGKQPFVGLIVSSYDKELPSHEAVHRWFNVIPYSDSGRSKQQVHIPMRVAVEDGILAEINMSPHLGLTDADTLLEKLMELTVDPEPTTATPQVVDGSIEAREDGEGGEEEGQSSAVGIEGPGIEGPGSRRKTLQCLGHSHSHDVGCGNRESAMMDSERDEEGAAGDLGCLLSRPRAGKFLHCGEQ